MLVTNLKVNRWKNPTVQTVSGSPCMHKPFKSNNYNGNFECECMIGKTSFSLTACNDIYLPQRSTDSSYPVWQSDSPLHAAVLLKHWFSPWESITEHCKNPSPHSVGKLNVCSFLPENLNFNHIIQKTDNLAHSNTGFITAWKCA